MEDRQTLHSYLYETLQTQMVSGKLRYGESLPSWSQLSTLYNVGIRTVKDVMRALQQDGYIATEKRKNAVVIYQEENSELHPQQLYIQSLLVKSASLAEASYVVECIVPEMIARCVPLCDESDVRQLHRIADSYSAHSEKELSRVSSMFLQHILKQYRNPLLIDLFIDLDLFIRIPALCFGDNPFDQLSMGAKEKLHGLADMVREGNAEDIRQRLRKTFAHNRTENTRYIESLAASGENAEKTNPVRFHWNVEKGRLFGYTYVVRDLILKMVYCQYEDGEFLPSAAQLSAQYAASLVTIRKALSVLSALGVVRSINGKGTQVTLREAANRRLWERGGDEVKRELMLYLYTLQLITVLGAYIAQEAFNFITPEKIERLEARLGESSSLKTPPLFMSCFLECLRSQVLRDITEGLNLLLEWGQCMSFSDKNKPEMTAATLQHRILVERLRAGDKQGFADGIQELYTDIFLSVRKKLTELGCAEAEKVPLPPNR